MADQKKIKVKRSEFATFLNTAPSASSPVWSRFGKGVTGQSVSYNPTVNSEQYIDEDNATSSVDAYAPVINTPQTAYKNDAVFEFVDNLRRTRAIGDDAVTDVLMVYIYAKGEDGSYPAEKQSASISITDFGGEAGNPLNITYDIGFVGDPVQGNVTIANGVATFTENGVTPKNSNDQKGA